MARERASGVLRIQRRLADEGCGRHFAAGPEPPFVLVGSSLFCLDYALRKPSQKMEKYGTVRFNVPIKIENMTGSRKTSIKSFSQRSLSAITTRRRRSAPKAFPADSLQEENDQIQSPRTACLRLRLGTIRLTYQPTSPSSVADRPATKPTEEIEVTAAMIAAGLDEFWIRLMELSPAPSEVSIAEEALRAFYVRMHKARTVA